MTVEDEATREATLRRIKAETEKVVAETLLIEAQTRRKLDLEIARLVADTAKINNESRWYPLVVGSGLTLAIVAVVKLFM